MDMPDQDRRSPLSQPTAARMFELLNSSRRRLSTAEVAELAEVHPNSARLHLARLSEAGLVERSTAASGQGRPHYEWWISPGARIGGERPVAYRELATWLSRSISTFDGELKGIEAAGREIGRSLAPAEGRGEPAEALQSALSAMGFQPRRRNDGSRTTFTLCNCPYRDVARANPAVVCTFHRGIACGLVGQVDPESELTGFVIKDPDRAGCMIEIETPARSISAKES
jgi:predicted ArsR family transcriptional regulator